MYKASFLSDDQRKWSREEKRRLNQLVSAIREHVRITELTLKQHKKIGSNPQLQEKMEQSLAALKQRFARELRTTRRLRNFFIIFTSLLVVAVAVGVVYVPAPTWQLWLHWGQTQTRELIALVKPVIELLKPVITPLINTVKDLLNSL